jgi:hypothetical protein
MKEAHKQIEDIEKSRKISAIRSITERIDNNIIMAQAIIDGFKEVKEKNPKVSLKEFILKSGDRTKKFLDAVVTTYESIRFDLEKNININQKDFDRLFPKIDLHFDTYDSISPNLACLIHHMIDMKNYCIRLI